MFAASTQTEPVGHGQGMMGNRTGWEPGIRQGCPRGINLSLNRGFRRGEGGWVDGWWAFMVARGWGMRPIDEPTCPGDQRRATIKAHPTPRHFVLYPALQRRYASSATHSAVLQGLPSPLQVLMGFI